MSNPNRIERLAIKMFENLEGMAQKNNMPFELKLEEIINKATEKSNELNNSYKYLSFIPFIIGKGLSRNQLIIFILFILILIIFTIYTSIKSEREYNDLRNSLTENSTQEEIDNVESIKPSPGRIILNFIISLLVGIIVLIIVFNRVYKKTLEGNIMSELFPPNEGSGLGQGQGQRQPQRRATR